MIRFTPSFARLGSLAIAGVLLHLSSLAEARPFRVAQIPNGSVNPINGCGTCHINPNGGGARNPFGVEIENNFLDAPGSAGNVLWGSVLAGRDSDGDGRSNGVELLDPAGVWERGPPPDPNPGNPANVRNPGVIDAGPARVPVLTPVATLLLGGALSALALRVRRRGGLVPGRARRRPLATPAE